MNIAVVMTDPDMVDSCNCHDINFINDADVFLDDDEPTLRIPIHELMARIRETDLPSVVLADDVGWHELPDAPEQPVTASVLPDTHREGRGVSNLDQQSAPIPPQPQSLATVFRVETFNLTWFDYLLVGGFFIMALSMIAHLMRWVFTLLVHF